MADLLIKEEELAQLDKLIGDGLSYRQAAPIVNFFLLLNQKRAAEAKAAEGEAPAPELKAIIGGKEPENAA